MNEIIENSTIIKRREKRLRRFCNEDLPEDFELGVKLIKDTAKIICRGNEKEIKALLKGVYLCKDRDHGIKQFNEGIKRVRMIEWLVDIWYLNRDKPLIQIIECYMFQIKETMKIIGDLEVFSFEDEMLRWLAIYFCSKYNELHKNLLR